MRLYTLPALLGLLSLLFATAPAAAQTTAATPTPAVVTSDNLLDVAVSDSSTTYLVFGGPVSLVDVGMAGNYLVKIEANAVFVRAKRKHVPPTPMLIRYGSKYWMGRLVYTGRPVLQLYDFQKDGALRINGKSTASAGAPPENELALDKEQEKKAVVEGKLSQLRKAREEHQAVAVVDNDLVLSLANVRNDKDFTYLRFKVINKTNIDYNVDFTDFQLVENAQKKFLARKKNEARRPLAPSGGRPNQVITGRTTGYLTYAIPLYAATERGYLEVTLRELNGARVLVLPVPSRVINRAATI
ncbi:hypothetical protein HNQ93_004153 [Hymenobacter luteus]|uniref:DUF4138 domain-containing protein n=2 Tax=Hymenobacter TaxID=89966 RepID=A0A7W9T5L4_9BACT|nr:MULTISPECIES: DUF4138 domain-containing protein [Hymenobacter]MBB4603553.1 hypothetical protein [Hymenobacter latericoloratus]MBB6061274.1 hypothetical protein [Hymenobacter luteus]